ncbi:hypothetical protein CEXT_254581 [Caerostris extrusa]|uniref:Uncharacterized protein n=1 Tax=Caerostris extrusa TaxID=172846 RepID=A0AAV4NT75_CAEEX|nr:hypothetical protein CEXT_254581 [Caerostris extrusa]
MATRSPDITPLVSTSGTMSKIGHARDACDLRHRICSQMCQSIFQSNVMFQQNGTSQHWSSRRHATPIVMLVISAIEFAVKCQSIFQSNVMFQQNGASQHWSSDVRRSLDKTFLQQWIGRDGHPRSQI